MASQTVTLESGLPPTTNGPLRQVGAQPGGAAVTVPERRGETSSMGLLDWVVRFLNSLLLE